MNVSQLTAEQCAELLHTPAYQAALSTLDRQLVFDMDETLNSNRVLFAESVELTLDVYRTLDSAGRSRETLAAVRLDIDRSLLPSLGFTPERWRAAAHQAADVIAARRLTTSERSDVAAAAEHALGVGTVLPGVERALEALTRAGVTIVLKTKGCTDKQAEKLAAHRFDRFFGQAIHIVAVKTPESFRALADAYAMTRPVSVGDSAPSDILPALAAGYEAVFIHSDAASQGRTEGEADHDAPSVSSMPHAVHAVLDLAAASPRLGSAARAVSTPEAPILS